VKRILLTALATASSLAIFAAEALAKTNIG
jgi:hypothetical protein